MHFLSKTDGTYVLAFKCLVTIKALFTSPGFIFKFTFKVYRPYMPDLC